jgi:glycosyltransferase involved in cell wall biosynthesis
MSSNKERSTILYIQGTNRMGGSIESLILLINSLPKDRFNPIVICSEKSKLTDRLEREGIQYKIIMMGMWRKAKYFPIIPISLHRLFYFAKRKKAILIHANSLWDSPYAVTIARLLKIPSVVHIRTEHPTERARKYKLHRADAIITISDSLKKPFESFPKLTNKMTTIYNGIDISTFDLIRKTKSHNLHKNSDSYFTIGYIGRIDPEKGLVELVKSIGILRKSNAKIKLVIIGDIGRRAEPFYRDLVLLCQELGIENYVEFKGYKENIIDDIFGFDLLVLPSYREGFGRTLIEAMAAGIPVIGTDVGGIPEIIDNGKNGFIVPPKDPQAIADAIQILLNDEDLQLKMGENGLNKVREKFTAEKIMQAIIDLYERLDNSL